MLSKEQLEKMVGYPITGKEATTQYIAVLLKELLAETKKVVTSNNAILEELKKQTSAPVQELPAEAGEEVKPKKRTTRKKKTEEAGE